MDPHRTLFETSLVRLAIAIPLLLAIGAAALILLDPETVGKVGLGSLREVQETYRTLTIPFLLWSLSIPFTALVAGHHRSLQSRHQIQIQDQQNIFSNYVKHRELFIDFCEQTKALPEGTKESNELYELIFPEASEGFLKPSDEVAPRLQRRVENVYKHLITELDRSIEQGDFFLNSPPIKHEISRLGEIYKTFSKKDILASSQSFENDGLIIVRSSVLRMKALLTGLNSCCNFLRSYYPNTKAFTLEEITESIMIRIEALSPRFYALKQTREAIKRHTESEADETFRSLGSLLPESLEDIHNNNQLYLLDAPELKSFLEEVLLQHLTDEEFSLIENHMPRDWVDAMDYDAGDTIR